VRLFKTILLLMLVAGIVPTAMVAVLSVSDTGEALVRNAQELAQERVKHLSLKTRNLLDEPVRAVAGLAAIPRFLELTQAEQQAHLRAVLNQRPEVMAVTVFSAQRERLPGLQAWAESSPSEVSEHEARALEILKSGAANVRFSDVYVRASHKQPAITVVLAVGEPVSRYIAAEISLVGLTEVLNQQKVGSTGFAYVVDRHGRLVAGAPGLGQLEPLSDLRGRPAVAQAVASGSPLIQVGNFGVGDERVVAAYAVLEDRGWGIISEQPTMLAYRDAAVMQRRILVGFGVALLVAAALAGLFSRNVTQPLKGFTAGAMEIARGKFGVVVDVKKKNELGELAQTFNYMSQQLEAYGQETTRLYESLEKGYLETIVALANSIDSKDSYTRGHSQRVGDIAVEIGTEMGLPRHELRYLHYGGILHDIGKIGIIESILCKQGRLTDEEMAVMREHPAIGDSIIAPVTFLGPVRSAVRSHHENWDGTGYPDKLKGEEIPMLARIVACADTFDACTSTRPYQKAMPLEVAMDILNKLKGARLDPNVVDALRRVLEKRGVRVEGQRQPVKLAS